MGDKRWLAAQFVFFMKTQRLLFHVFGFDNGCGIRRNSLTEDLCKLRQTRAYVIWDTRETFNPWFSFGFLASRPTQDDRPTTSVAEERCREAPDRERLLTDRCQNGKNEGRVIGASRPTHNTRTKLRPPLGDSQKPPLREGGK